MMPGPGLESIFNAGTVLSRSRSVGEICTRFFDVEGRPCVTALDRRLVALDLNQLRAVPLVVCVASGTSKAAAILGAVRGGYVNSLVTDDVTAAEVLTLARPFSGGAGVEDAAPTNDGRGTLSGVGLPPGR